MSSCQKTACQGCSCNSTKAPADIEDCFNELNALRRRNQELETRLKLDESRNWKPQVLREPGKTLRSSAWFDCKDDPGMTALYMERFFNFGITREELMSGKPMIGIAQSGSDLAPCNRHHIELAKRVRDGIRDAGALPFEFPTHPIQESTKRPTAALDRNLAYLSLVELLTGYFLDGVVLLTGCDKTTPAFLMAVATVNIPAICLNVGPMLNGYTRDGALTGSGAVVWKGRELYATGEIDESQLVDYVSVGTPSVGHCNTMGTASTMNALAECLGMALPGSAAIPAAYRQRGQCAYETGKCIVEMVHSDRKPSDIMTREAFENAIIANAAIGGSTNAPVHINAIAQHMGVEISMEDWQLGTNIPLLLNMQPSGEYLGEEYHRAGGLPAVLVELSEADKLHTNILTCNGKTLAENIRDKDTSDRRVIRPFHDPLMQNAGFLHLRGTLFDSAIMKTCVISPAFRQRYLSNPKDPEAFEGPVVVFEGPEDYHNRIENLPGVNEETILVMRGVGPLGYPGAAEVVNMQPPSRLLKNGVSSLFCIGDGRQSGTSASPSILNASPEAAAGGNLSLLRDGDRLRIDLKKRRVDLLIDSEEFERRRDTKNGQCQQVASQTPWQEIFSKETDQLSNGMVLRNAIKYQRLAQIHGSPRHNH